jgi:hypothetical protein
MRFTDARTIDSICWQIRQADFTRGRDRSRIDNLFNGFPPYSKAEVQENRTAVNVNFLEAARLSHDARSQFSNAFLKPGIFFTCRTDYGNKYKRQLYGAKVTRKINRFLKRSTDYMECNRSQFALDVLHGIGPAAWRDQDFWCPDAQAIADIGIPARTLLTMRNLPFFYVYRSLTHPELYRMTHGPKVDPGWNMPLVKRALKWLEQETLEMIGQNWQDYWSPEKVQEAVKGDGGFFVGDQAATLNVFDFYYLDQENKDAGWRRRMLLDAWSTPELGADGKIERITRKGDRGREKFWANATNDFLYTSRDKKFADKREHIVTFQFADLSAVAPFQYHSVRSLGFLLFAVCHLQNRLRCSFTEAVFENLLQMFRIKSMDDVQRALKLKLHGFAFIDDNLVPVPADQRFQPNQGLVELGLNQNSQLIQEHSSSYTQNQNFSRDRTEKTKFQVMAEVNAVTSLVSAGLNQAYAYKSTEYYEIVRRFMKKHSADPEVKLFRGECLADGVPAEVLIPEAWEVEPEKIMGGGNKTLEMTIANQLMEWRQYYNPTAQNSILRRATLAFSDDPAWADTLVPEEPKVSDTIHDTELAFGTLMSGVEVTPKEGLNPVEVAAKTIQLMGQELQKIKATGGAGTPEDLMGFAAAQKYATAFIEQLAQDDKAKPVVKKLNDAMTQIMNEVKGLAQQQQKMAQAAAQANGQQQMDPKDAAKIQATQLTAQQKVQNMKESHALKTAQRKIQFEQQFREDQQKHAAEMQEQAARVAIDLHGQALKNRMAAEKPKGGNGD